MEDRQITRRDVLKVAGAAGVLGALTIPAAALADEEKNERRVRWDIINVGTGCVAPSVVGRCSQCAEIISTLLGRGMALDQR